MSTLNCHISTNVLHLMYSITILKNLAFVTFWFIQTTAILSNAYVALINRILIVIIGLLFINDSAYEYVQHGRKTFNTLRHLYT